MNSVISSENPVRTGPENWFMRSDQASEKYVWLIAAGLVAASFLARLCLALQGYLNPDEIYHVLISGDTTLAGALDGMARTRSPHPIFYVVVLYLLNLVNASDFLMRLPSVVAGALVPLFGYLWMRKVSGSAAGLGAAALLAFLPETIRLSAQIREYALLMMFVIAALYFMELGLDKQRVFPILVSGGLMLFALATHYATIWMAPAIAAYGFARLFAGRAPRRLWIAWVGIQLAFAGGLAVAWFSHVSSLMGDKQSTATEGWLRTSYFHRDTDNLLFYPFRQTARVFRYLFSGGLTGWVGLLATTAGIAVAVLRRRPALALLLVMPFGINCVASFLKLYPYGDTRHILHLVLFAACAIGFLLAELSHRRPLVVLASVSLLLLYANIRPSWPGQFIHPRDQRRELMADAIAYLEASVPPGDIIFCDHQTSVVLRYYLGRSRTLGDARSIEGFVELDAGERLLIRPSVNRVYWLFSASSFSEEFHEMVRTLDFGLDRTVWVCAAGWGHNLASDLEWTYGVRLPGVKRFGRAISVFPMSGRTLPNSPRVAVALESLAVQAVPQLGDRARTVFWPSDHDTTGRAATIAADIAQELISYRQLNMELGSGTRSLPDCLPALAFWVFDNLERHSVLMRYMDDLEHYIADDYRFTLLAVDPDTLVGVYLVEEFALPGAPR